jgi:hypothetical protein
MRRARGVLLLAAAVGALSGCGGSGGPKPAATTTSAPTTPRTTVPKATAPKVTPAVSSVATRYEAQMQVLGSQLSAYFAKVGAADGTASLKQAAANLKGVQVHLRNAAVKLAAMKLPPKLDADQQRLIVAVHEYADELNQIIVQVKAGNRAALAAISDLKGIRDMGEATQAITKAGYNITGGGPLSG